MNDNESLRLAMLRVLDAVKRRDSAREDLAAAEHDLADARRAMDVLMDELAAPADVPLTAENIRNAHEFVQRVGHKGVVMWRRGYDGLWCPVTHKPTPGNCLGDHDVVACMGLAFQGARVTKWKDGAA